MATGRAEADVSRTRISLEGRERTLASGRRQAVQCVEVCEWLKWIRAQTGTDVDYKPPKDHEYPGIAGLLMYHCSCRICSGVLISYNW